MRRTIAFVVVLSVALFGWNAAALAGNPSSGSSFESFTDVPADHWAYEELLALHQRGVISGYGDGTLRPDAVVLRGEFAKMMVLALDLSLAKADSPTFLDVPTDHWAFRYVETARLYLTGFRTSLGDYFRPLYAAVREDMAVALVNALGYASEAEDEDILQSFADRADISTNLRAYVAVAVERGVMEGYPDEGAGRNFRPMASLTRAEAAALLYRLISGEDGVKVTYDSAGTPGTGTGSTPGSSGERPAPEVTAVVAGGKVLVTWDPIHHDQFQGYKVVISRNDSSPAYPEDGYLYYITNPDETSANVDNIHKYNGGDFGGYLLPGAAYYFSVTALYDDCKVAGNAVRLAYPGP